jgi:hypothetical protein
MRVSRAVIVTIAISLVVAVLWSLIHRSAEPEGRMVKLPVPGANGPCEISLWLPQYLQVMPSQHYRTTDDGRDSQAVGMLPIDISRPSRSGMLSQVSMVDIYYMPNKQRQSIKQCAYLFYQERMRLGKYQLIKEEPLAGKEEIGRLRQIYREPGENFDSIKRITYITDPTTHCCYVIVCLCAENHKRSRYTEKMKWAGISQMEESLSLESDLHR